MQSGTSKKAERVGCETRESRRLINKLYKEMKEMKCEECSKRMEVRRDISMKEYEKMAVRQNIVVKEYVPATELYPIDEDGFKNLGEVIMWAERRGYKWAKKGDTLFVRMIGRDYQHELKERVIIYIVD